MKSNLARRSTVEKHALPFITRTAVMRAGRTLEQPRVFDTESFFRAAGLDKGAVVYARGAVVFSQGDAPDSVMYIQQGTIKLSVTSYSGKEAIVAMLESGDFFGESALAAQPVRQERATAITATRVLTIQKEHMIRLLHEQHGFSGRFITHMLARNTRIEEDLADQLFNSSEKRLARTLMLLAHADRTAQTPCVLPRISQQTLAEMIGTTRSRVNFFMNKFKKLGFIECDGNLTVNTSLSTVFSYDERTGPRARKATS
jgi:CRP/FNR family cyclic AMP-dependent transcriptional regulator